MLVVERVRICLGRSRFPSNRTAEGPRNARALTFQQQPSAADGGQHPSPTLISLCRLCKIKHHPGFVPSSALLLNARVQLGRCIASGSRLLYVAARTSTGQRSSGPNNFRRRLVLARSRAVTAAFELVRRPDVIEHKSPKIASRSKSGMKDAACTPTDLLSQRAWSASTWVRSCHE
jgi:hypothetical protein